MAVGVTVDFTANLARFTSAIDKATGDLSKFQKNSDRIAGQVKGAFGALGIGLGVAGIVAFGKSVLNAADNLNDMSVRTGTSVKDLASLKTAAEQNGTTLDGVATALQKLTLSFGQAQGGNKEMAVALNRLGVTSVEARERLFQLADAYVKSGGDARTLADMQKVLGKGYAEALPLLAQGAEGLRKSAAESESFADSMARLAPNADKFNDNLASLKNNAVGLAAILIGPLVTGINALAEGFKSALGGAGPLADEMAFLADTAAGMSAPFLIAGKSIGALFAMEGLDDKGRAGVIQAYKKDLDDIVTSLSKHKDELARIRAGGAPLVTPPGVTPRDVTPFDVLDDTKQKARASFIQSLKDQQAELGKTTEDIQLYKAAQLGIVGSQLDVVRGILVQNASYEEGVQHFKDGMKAVEDATEIEKKAQEAAAAVTQSLKEQALAIAEQIDPQLKLNNALKLFGDQLAENVITQQEYNLLFDDSINKMVEKTNIGTDEMAEFAKRAASNMQDSFADFLFDPFSKGLKGMLSGFLDLLRRMVAEAAAADIMRLMGFGKDGGFFKEIFGNVLGSAKGNVFNSGTGLAVYKNSVVSQPTLFPFARGIGLMGEKPGSPGEAIMPLSRMSGGDLGVKVSGGGNVSVVVNVDASGTQTQGNGQNANELGRMIGSAVRGVLIQEKRPGGLLA